MIRACISSFRFNGCSGLPAYQLYGMSRDRGKLQPRDVARDVMDYSGMTSRPVARRRHGARNFSFS